MNDKYSARCGCSDMWCGESRRVKEWAIVRALIASMQSINYITIVQHQTHIYYWRLFRETTITTTQAALNII